MEASVPSTPDVSALPPTMQTILTPAPPRGSTARASSGFLPALPAAAVLRVASARERGQEAEAERAEQRRGQHGVGTRRGLPTVVLGCCSGSGQGGCRSSPRRSRPARRVPFASHR
jgi:hypothetical protein